MKGELKFIPAGVQDGTSFSYWKAKTDKGETTHSAVSWKSTGEEFLEEKDRVLEKAIDWLHEKGFMKGQQLRAIKTV